VKATVISYYSNLKRTVEAIQTTLAVQVDKNRGIIRRSGNKGAKQVRRGTLTPREQSFFQLMMEKVGKFSVYNFRIDEKPTANATF
jgi:hypothetical protein